MIIGVDFDGVVFDTERYFSTIADFYDKYVFKKNSRISDSIRMQERYNWSAEEFKLYMEETCIKIEETAPLQPYAKNFLDLLKNDGHTIIGLTARGLNFPEEIRASEKRIIENELPIDKVIYNLQSKVQACKENNVDIMIDDLSRNCKELANNGIPTLFFNDLYEPIDEKLNDKMFSVQNWAEIYDFIKRKADEKKVND